jgi:hypothetical protein
MGYGMVRAWRIRTIDSGAWHGVPSTEPIRQARDAEAIALPGSLSDVLNFCPHIVNRAKRYWQILAKCGNVTQAVI